MAIINNLYVFVQDEDVQRGISVSEHPVEKGLNISDGVKREPIVLKIKGEIVGDNADSILSELEKLHKKGKYVKYVGRNVLSNAIITVFNTSHPNTIYGGCAFDMEIKEIRIAKSPLKKKGGQKTSGGSKQVSSKNKSSTKKYTVKKGDTLWKIAQSQYKDGSKYKKIMKANNLKTKDSIKVGQKLKIPK